MYSLSDYTSNIQFKFIIVADYQKETPSAPAGEQIQTSNALKFQSFRTGDHDTF